MPTVNLAIVPLGDLAGKKAEIFRNRLKTKTQLAGSSFFLCYSLSCVFEEFNFLLDLSDHKGDAVVLCGQCSKESLLKRLKIAELSVRLFLPICFLQDFQQPQIKVRTSEWAEYILKNSKFPDDSLYHWVELEKAKPVESKPVEVAATAPTSTESSEPQRNTKTPSARPFHKRQHAPKIVYSTDEEGRSDEEMRGLDFSCTGGC